MVKDDAENESTWKTIIGFVILAFIVLGVESCQESRQRRQEAEQHFRNQNKN